MAWTTARLCLFLFGICQAVTGAWGAELVTRDRLSGTDEFEQMSDSYWQYYEDCDRWGVKFSLLLGESQADVAEEIVPEPLAGSPLDDERADLTPVVEESLTESALQAQWRLSYLFHAVSNRNLLERFSYSRLSERFEWVRITDDSIRGLWEAIEFEMVESRGIELDLFPPAPAHPVALLIRAGFEARSSNVRDVESGGNSNAISIVSVWVSVWYSDSVDWVHHTALPEVARQINKIESDRIAREFAMRSGLANRLDCFALKLQNLADTIRPHAMGNGKRESIASGRESALME